MLAFLVSLDIHFQYFLILGGYYVYANCWKTSDEVFVYLLDGNAAFKSKEWVCSIS